MSEDNEYLPSIQKAKLERRNKMSGEKDGINFFNEGKGETKSDLNTVDQEELPDLNDIEKRIDGLNEPFKRDPVILNELPEPIDDQEEPMTTERKIYLLSKIFPLAIGDRIKNLFDEDGIIDLVGLDDRGVVYLIQYKENRISWESEHKIRKNESYLDSQKDSNKQPGIKTDIPDVPDTPQEELSAEEKKREKDFKDMPIG